MKSRRVAAILDRRTFLQLSSAAAAQMGWLRMAWGEEAASYVTTNTSYGKLRGLSVGGVNVFKGIPYGGSTAGKNRFMPPTRPAPWTGVRDALEFGATAPQSSFSMEIHNYVPKPPVWPGVPPAGEDCLALNVFTPQLRGKRPVMVWQEGGGFSGGCGSLQAYNGVNLAHNQDVVVVTLNHRLTVFGQTYLEEVLGPEFAASSAVGMLDVVAALQWVHDNIEHFGGDPARVTLFGQGGGGHKVALLMAMPAAKGLFQRAIVESGPLLKVVSKERGIELTNVLLQELGIDRSRARELQDVPLEKLLAASIEANKKIKLIEPGEVANTPVVDGHFIPVNPWDPAAPVASAHVPLIIGWMRTEALGASQFPTPENLALDEAGLRKRVSTSMGIDDPSAVIAAFRQTFPDSTPWDLWIYILTAYPRATYTQEMAKRRVRQPGAAPVWVYRFDFESPEDGGRFRSRHGMDMEFVWEHVDEGGPLISKMPEAHMLEDKVSSTWAAFARTGNPNNAKLSSWPAYSLATRPTMLFDKECGVENDPQHVARVAMEKAMGLS
jgi:para-nitrobenzyl esterase